MCPCTPDPGAQWPPTFRIAKKLKTACQHIMCFGFCDKKNRIAIAHLRNGVPHFTTQRFGFMTLGLGTCAQHHQIPVSGHTTTKITPLHAVVKHSEKFATLF